MRYRLDDIDAFLHAVEMGSISTAAVQMNLTKSVVSKRVSDLEKALGVVLLDRSTRARHRRTKEKCSMHGVEPSCRRLMTPRTRCRERTAS
jgi:hypothetical protein